MAKSLAARSLLHQTGTWSNAQRATRGSEAPPELSRHLLWLIIIRAVITFLSLNLADPLGLFPPRLGPFPFAPFFNILFLTLTVGYLLLLWNGWQLKLQLYVQIFVDLCLATILIYNTHGIESPFVSFYLLIIIYSGLMLGRNGGMVGAALSTILYAGIVAAHHLGIVSPGSASMESMTLTFRTSVHAMGFFAVAYLGTHLSRRLRAVQIELQEKIASLNRLQRLNELIVSSIRSGLVTVDLKGQIAVFNNSAAELLEMESAEVLQRPVQSVLGEQFWQRILASDLFRDARPLRHEDWFVTPSGARRFLGFSVSPLVDDRQALIGYIISFQDLTELKHLEEEIRLKDRMAAVGRMAAGIAHEIRNPLTSMRGSVEILRSHARFAKTDERLLDILIRESDRLNKFVEDFLQFARPAKSAHCALDLVALLRDSVTLLQNSPEVRDKHKVELNLEAKEIPIVGSPDQLKQVFWNLAQNAVRAMPTGGTLTISARRLDDRGGEVVFQDDGIGMSREEQEQLFQPLPPGFTGGTGLGLSIIFQIMEDHRGRIAFDSERGRGTRVTLYLPPEPAVRPTIH